MELDVEFFCCSDLGSDQVVVIAWMHVEVIGGCGAAVESELGQFDSR